MTDDELIAAIFDCVTRDNALEAMCGAFALRFRCPSAVMVYVDLAWPHANFFANYGLFDNAAVARYRAEFASEDPAPAMMARIPVGQAVATDRVFDQDQQRTSRFLREFYHPLGLREALGGPFLRDGQQFGILAVHRGMDRPPFQDDDITLFQRFMPHLAQSIGLRRKFFDMAAKTEATEASLAVAPTAILSFDATGILVHANIAARHLLSAAHELFLTKEGRLGAFNPHARRLLEALFEAKDGRLANRTIIRIPKKGGGGSAFVVRAKRLRSIEEAQGWTLQICDPASILDIDAAALAEAMAISASSARLVAALVQGDDLKSYADSTGLSMSTVKFHLNNAFEKTMTRRQTDLVRLASTIARDLGLTL